MRDDEIKAMFSEAGRIDASREAKQRAIRAALVEFRGAGLQAAEQEDSQQNRNFFQGLFQWRRPRVGKPTDNFPDEKRSRTMNTHQFKWQYAGIASASVLAIAVLIAYQQPDKSIHQSKTEYDRRTSIRLDTSSDKKELEEAVVTAMKQESREMDAAASIAQEPPAEYRQGNENKIARLAKPQAKGEAGTLVDSAGQFAAFKALPSSPAAEVIAAPGYKDVGRDRFESFDENPVKRVADDPVSTFSVDVDTASYSFVRRQLNQGVLPQKDAVRVEEMVNYFDYQYPLPESRTQPFTTSVNVTDSPWKPGNKLVHIGIKGYELPASELPRSNLVFLLDVSGSMNSPDKLPLVKQSMELLLSQLQPEDTVAIAVYAGAAGTVLEPTPVKDKTKILAALNRLQAGGSTAGGEGLKLAYQLAESGFDKKAVNRIILATDGDFNVGISNREELKSFVERKREEGIYLSVLGFGQGNYHDQLMQALAQNGNGVAAYIDTLGEAQKVLVHQATSTLFPIASDVKIQLEFNPATVSEYRLLGYETRHLEAEDFNNDKVDAGDIGSGHTVTAIYEITPVGSKSGLLPQSRYNKPGSVESSGGGQDEYGFLKLRYKLPGETVSKLISQPIAISGANSGSALTREAGFATAVAGFAQLLKGGQYTGSWSYDDAITLAQQNKGEDLYGYRTELVQLIRKAKTAADM